MSKNHKGGRGGFIEDHGQLKKRKQYSHKMREKEDEQYLVKRT